MKYEELKMLLPEDFRRFCGVKPETFAAMLLALQEDYQKKHRRGGREAHISLEEIPTKSSKHKPLDKEKREYNRQVASQRIGNEHAIGFIKRFRIVAGRYRNRLRRFSLRFTLIAAICNFEIA